MVNELTTGRVKMKPLERNETKLHNRLSSIGLKGLFPVEVDLWWGLVRLIMNKGSQPLVLSYREIASLTMYDETKRTKEDFAIDLASTFSKITSLNSQIRDPKTDKVIFFTLFPQANVDPITKNVTIQVSEHFVPWFNDLRENYTRIDLSVLWGLNSFYSKEFYRYLMRFRNTGYWVVKYDEFRRLMSIPSLYYRSDIERRVFRPIKEELLTKNSEGWSPLESLTIKPIMKKGTLSKVDRYEFIFKVSEPSTDVVQDAEKHEDEMFRLGVSKEKTPYTNNFTNGYIPGTNSSVEGFVKWLNSLNFFDKYSEYFDERSDALRDLKTLYKEEVVTRNSNAWTDMRFFAVLKGVIEEEAPMKLWAFQDVYAKIKNNKLTVFIDPEIYDDLPADKSEMLEAFVRYGDVMKAVKD